MLFGQARVLTRRARASTGLYEVRGISEGGNKLKLVASLILLPIDLDFFRAW